MTLWSARQRFKPPSTATNYSSWVLFPKDELLSLIKLNAGEPKSLRSLSLKFESSNERERSNDTIKNSLVRINIYEAANDSIQKHIYSGGPIKINGIDNDILTINLAGENIELGQKGLFVGIEMLGYVDTHGNLIYENSYARPGLSRKTSKVISVKSYLRSIFDSKNDMKLISDILKSRPNMDELDVRNLSVGLTLK